MALTCASGVFHALNMASAPQPLSDEGTTVGRAWTFEHLGSFAPPTYWYEQPPLGWLQLSTWTWLTSAFERAPTAVAAGREAMLVAHVLSASLLWVLARRRWARPVGGGARPRGVRAVASGRSVPPPSLPRQPGNAVGTRRVRPGVQPSTADGRIRRQRGVPWDGHAHQLHRVAGPAGTSAAGLAVEPSLGPPLRAGGLRLALRARLRPVPARRSPSWSATARGRPPQSHPGGMVPAVRPGRGRQHLRSRLLQTSRGLVMACLRHGRACPRPSRCAASARSRTPVAATRRGLSCPRGRGTSPRPHASFPGRRPPRVRRRANRRGRGTCMGPKCRGASPVAGRPPGTAVRSLACGDRGGHRGVR